MACFDERNWQCPKCLQLGCNEECEESNMGMSELLERHHHVAGSRPITITDLTELLKEAASQHHHYETIVLEGEKDEHWPEWYANYIFSRLPQGMGRND